MLIVEFGEDVSQRIVASPAANLLRHYEIIFAIGGSPQSAGAEGIFFDFYAPSVGEFFFDLRAGNNYDHTLCRDLTAGYITRFSFWAGLLQVMLYVFKTWHPSQFFHDKTRIVPQQIPDHFVDIILNRVDIQSNHLEAGHIFAGDVIAPVA
ncbi:MAG TPA: hypothetical protein VK779_00575 [Rhizomicrobium sp.]|jgi:hypothetical protein|nr:hypothetical protein [Rhizomicrobium sp.]